MVNEIPNDMRVILLESMKGSNQRPSPLINTVNKAVKLLYSNRFGKVSRLIYVTIPHNGNVI